MTKLGKWGRWAALIAGGTILLQVPSCIDIVQTGLLAFIGGVAYYLARNV
ncbi:MAG: hypothetical protein FWC56_04330 [Phycisphaerae bacterium]|nr:hypothetical protein [Phycisphaerae bacterium]